MHSTLVLNASYEPLHILSAHRAITLILKGKAISVDDSSVIIRSEKQTFSAPYVIALSRMVPQRARRIGFSRRGVLVRDEFICHYCSKHATTIDHVVPSSQGGATSYENCVAACASCNLKKADKSLREMGWSLMHQPVTPSPYSMLLLRCDKGSEAWNIWSPYIHAWQ